MADPNPHAPVLLVLSGPGGVGKGSLVRLLLEREPDLWVSRSWTTRAPRPGEAPDAYHFVDRATFDAAIEAGGFYEWAEFLGNRYGTPIPDPPAGADVLLEIDVQGAAQVLARAADPLVVFLDAPSPDEQARRLRGRGDTEQQIAARLATSERERVEGRRLGARFVINDDLERACEEVRSLLAAARAAAR